MCGIVAVKKGSRATEKAFEGLKNLEYRGYDSAGIARLDDQIHVKKGTGEVEDAIKEIGSGESAIGHTRWATHGGVTDDNAHPHTDCEGKIAVAHNGIINNHEQLKEELKGRGHTFRSETDTEVIPHLIEEFLEENTLQEAAHKTMEKLEGSFAVTCLLESGDILAFRKDSPLVIGMGEDQKFIASDFTAFLEHTKKAMFLEDGDVAILNGDLKVFNERKQVEREIKEIDWNAGEATKAGHSHYMQKEIREQKSTIKRAAFQDKKDLDKAVEMIEEAENIYLTACGTASYAAELGAKYLRDAGYKPIVEQAHELEYRADEITEDDLVIAVSQSGETADLLSALDKTEASQLAIVNVVGSTLARESDHKIYVNAGPEIGVASTKAFTAQLTALKLISYVAKGETDEGRSSLIKTAEKVDEVLKTNESEINELAKYLAEKDDAYFIGRNLGRELALESALKLKELSYIHAEGFAGGEFKHGTLALIEDGVPVFAFLEHGGEEIKSNAIEARSRGADLIGVGTEPVNGFEHFIKVPEDENREILEVIPFQELAYLTALEKQNNPDKPRNLAKSVTVK
ncbi:glutamine--fructose-6-phosphate transaminase (isomerizing) [Candidatus Nanohalococcus occultus]|uniref:glutamine--fructose-6-phosphate transaminase (isomerizing) n=1 Tax=Candidatus Nanohalococcus occultus TaxID=2978047 RepID=UPI0039E011D3